MNIVEEIKIKSGTWGYVTDANGYIETGFVPGSGRDKPYQKDHWSKSPENLMHPHLGLNVILEGAVKVVGSARGRSAAGAYVVDSDGHEYYMSIDNVTQTLAALAEGTISATDGYIHGTWTLTKQGGTVSLKPYTMEK